MNSFKKCFSIAAIAILIVIVTALQVFAASSGTHTPVTGVTVGVSGATDNSMTNGAITVTATGSGGFFGIGASAKTATITITNDSGATATVSFDWTATSVNQLVIDGTTYSGTSGSFSKLLNAGASVVVTITTAQNSTTNTLVMSNFAVTAAADTSNVTIQFDSGSVTVDGAGVSNNSSHEIPLTGATISATAENFVGWIDTSNNQIISTTASFTLTPSNDMTIKAIHGPTARFFVGTFVANGGYLFKTLPEATAYASNGSNKTVVLANNGTLPDGSYTIPSGVTLLIPYDDANTLCTTKPTITTTNATSSASAYRMLTMASGAHITVNGALSVSGQQYCSRPIGAVSGKYGVIEMAESSSITVNSGGNLYAWGYIAGIKNSDGTVSEGTVTIKSGGTVYEDFQVVDWRGGSATTDLIDNSNKVFPMSQYYVQNVQVPMTLESGATENTFTSVNVTLVGTQEAPVTFIGTGGLFVLGNNTSVIKDYNEATDRLTLEIVKGSVSLGSVSMTLKISTLGGTKTINSANYVLPLNNNITIIANSDTTLSSANDVAMLPGSKLVLKDGATFNITGGNYYIYDLDEWTYDTADETIVSTLNGNTSNNGGYCSEFNWVMAAVPYAHDRIKTRTAADLEDVEVVVDGTINVSSGAYVYTTAGGANITSTGNGKIVFNGTPGDKTVTYQAIATDSDRTGVAYLEIPVTPAQLKNATENTPYAYTTGTTGTVTYTYSNDMWRRASNFHGISVSVNDALDLNFYIAKSELIQNYTYTATITKYFATGYTPGNGTITPTNYKIAQDDTDGDYKDRYYSTITIPLNAWTYLEEDGLYKFSFSDISAKEMCDDIIVTITYPDGETVISRTTSVQDYAVKALSVTGITDAQETALVDMLNYGAAAQKYYNYGEKDSNSALILATSGLTEAQLGFATASVDICTDSKNGSGLNSSCTWHVTVKDSNGKDFTPNGDNWGSRLLLNNRFGMHFTAHGLKEGMTATIILYDLDAEGNQINIVTLDEELTLQKGIGQDRKALYFFSTEALSQLKITNARKWIAITVYDGSSEFCTIVDSVERYISRMIAGEAKYTIDSVDGQYVFHTNSGNDSDPRMVLLTDLLEKLMKFSTSASADFDVEPVDAFKEVSTNG